MEGICLQLVWANKLTSTTSIRPSARLAFNAEVTVARSCRWTGLRTILDSQTAATRARYSSTSSSNKWTLAIAASRKTSRKGKLRYWESSTFHPSRDHSLTGLMVGGLRKIAKNLQIVRSSLAQTESFGTRRISIMAVGRAIMSPKSRYSPTRKHSLQVSVKLATQVQSRSGSSPWRCSVRCRPMVVRSSACV